MWNYLKILEQNEKIKEIKLKKLTASKSGGFSYALTVWNPVRFFA